MAKPSARQIYEKYAKEYKADFAPMSFQGSRTAFEFADEITWRFILSHLPESKGCRILDAGAGDGFWSEKLAKLGYKNITLADISQNMLLEAKKRLSTAKPQGNFKFIRSDIADMKMLPSGSFDFVFSQYDPVGYCMEPKKAMRELARVARKGAYISVMVDTKFRRVPELIAAGQAKEAKRLLRTSISHDYFHPQVNFTWESLSDCFTAAHLEVINVIGAPVFMHQVDDKTRAKLISSKRKFNELLALELGNCTDRSLINFAGHVQIIGRKPR